MSKKTKEIEIIDIKEDDIYIHIEGILYFLFFVGLVVFLFMPLLDILSQRDSIRIIDDYSNLRYIEKEEDSK